MLDPDDAVAGGLRWDRVGWDVNWHSAASSEGLTGGMLSRRLLHALMLDSDVSSAGSMSGLPACSGRFAAGSHPGL